MALTKVVFDDAPFTPRDMGAALAGVMADGRISGATVSYAGGNVGIAAGYIIACGRLIYNNGAIAVTPSGSSGVAQIVLVVDISGGGSLSIVTRIAASVDALPALTQENINDGVSTIYEMELALIDLTGGALIRSMPPVGLPIRVVNEAPAAGAPDGIYLIPQEVS